MAQTFFGNCNNWVLSLKAPICLENRVQSPWPVLESSFSLLLKHRILSALNADPNRSTLQVGTYLL